MKHLFILFALSFSVSTFAQLSVTTTNSFTNNNGSGTVTFNFQNTNSYPIIITGIDGVTGTSGTVTTQFFYKTTPLNGSPGTIDATGGWTLVSSGTITGVSNTSTTVTQNFLTGLSFMVPANTTYAFAVFATGQRYHTLAAGNYADSAYGVKILTGTNISYGGGTPPSTPTNTPRGWIGTIKFIPAISCSGMPTAGAAISSTSIACSGQSFLLSLAGDSIRQNLKYQWQVSATGAANSFSNLAGDTTHNISRIQAATSWYRCRVSCSVDTAYSDSVLVISPSGPMSGTFTVNPSATVSATNFHTLLDVATNLTCRGVSGPVVINVASATGPYAGQLNFGAISGVSDTNTIVINGNGNTITGMTSPLVRFTGSKYITLRNCTITGGTGYTGFGVHIGGQSQHIRLSNNVIDLGTTITSSASAGIVVSGSTTSATTTGNNGQYLTIDSNTVIGGYYGLTLIGNTGYQANYGNAVINNNFQDYYLYGLYMIHGDTIEVRKNSFGRPTRTTLSTFYGIFISTSRNIKVHQNSIRDGGSGSYTAYPIYMTNNVNATGYETEIVNNEIYNINTTGTFYGIYALTTGLTNTRFLHNTIHHNSTGGTGTKRGVFFNIARNGVIFRNNIISLDGSGTGTKHCIYVGNTTGTGNVFNNNVYHMGATAGTNNHLGYWSSDRTSLSDWQTASSGDANSLAANPLFTSVTAGNMIPLSGTLDNTGANVGVGVDILGQSRSSTTPDPGAYEYTGISSDIALTGVSMHRSGVCFSTADTIKFTVNRTVGATHNFATDSMRIIWSVTGPATSSGSMVVNSGTLANGNSATFSTTGVHFTAPGTYLASAYIVSAAWNGSSLNDTLTDFASTDVGPLISVIPKQTNIYSSTDTVELRATSPFFPVGDVYFTEICHFKTSTGAPTTGWPSYLIADDYVEITGPPMADMGGIVYEEWTSSSMAYTTTLPQGTRFGPNGTLIMAIGQLSSSQPSPSNYYYHVGNTSTHSSSTIMGYILRTSTGSIIDAVAYGNLTFPAAANVSSTDWTGTTTSGNSGIRMTSPRNKTSSAWVNSSTSPQNPNTLNSGVVLPSPPPVSGFAWQQFGVTFDTLPTVVVGPYSTLGTRTYVARYVSPCGVVTDTAVVNVDFLRINNISTTPSSCSSPTGSATATVAGGVSPYTYSWSAGGGGNPKTALAAGQYALTVTDADSNITVSNFSIGTTGTTLAFTATVQPTTNCTLNNGGISITATGGVSPYAYTFDGGSTFLSNSGVFTNVAAGSYTLGVRDSIGCIVFDTLPGVVGRPASPGAPTVTGISSYCTGDNLMPLLAALPSGVSSSAVVKWYSDSTLSSADSVGVGTTYAPTFSTAGNHYLYIAVSDSGCQGSYYQFVTTLVQSPATPTLGANTYSVCFGSALQSINASATAKVYWYDLPGLTTPVDSGLSFNAPVSATGSYTFYLQAHDTVTGCKSAPDSFIVRIDTLPVVSVTAPASICRDNANIPLNTGLPAGGLYTGTGVNGGNFFPSLSGPGKFAITYTYADANGCMGSAIDSIEVFDLPQVTFGTLANVCANAAAIVLSTGQPAGGGYFGTGISGGSFDPSVTGAGVYTLGYGYVDANGCTDTAYRSITVDTIPVVSLGAFGPVCEDGDSVILVGGLPMGGNYTGTGVAFGAFDPIVAGIGLHTLTYSFTDGKNCSNQANAAIEVVALPVFSLGNDTAFCGKQTVTLDAGLTGMQYLWSSGDTAQSITVSAAGVYSVIVTDPATTAMCSNSDTITVDYEATCVGISESLTSIADIRYYPNPNTGRFTLRAEGLDGMEVRLTVIDGLGKLVKEEVFAPAGAVLEQVIDLSGACAGVYYLHLHTERGVATHMITLRR
jgi:hypothetical protein